MDYLKKKNTFKYLEETILNGYLSKIIAIRPKHNKTIEKKNDNSNTEIPRLYFMLHPQKQAQLTYLLFLTGSTRNAV